MLSPHEGETPPFFYAYNYHTAGQGFTGQTLPTGDYTPLVIPRSTTEGFFSDPMGWLSDEAYTFQSDPRPADSSLLLPPGLYQVGIYALWPTNDTGIRGIVFDYADDRYDDTTREAPDPLIGQPHYGNDFLSGQRAHVATEVYQSGDFDYMRRAGTLFVPRHKDGYIRFAFQIYQNSGGDLDVQTFELQLRKVL